MHPFKRVAAAGLAVLMMVQTTGCHSWKTVPLPPPSAVSQHPERKVQVLLQDNSRLDADSATTDANTVIAYRRAIVDTIPLAAVKAVKIREGSALRTGGLVVGIAAGAFVTILLVALIICNVNGNCEGGPQTRAVPPR